MKYLKVDWKHTFPNDPLELFMELDAEDMEVRKVHIYPTATENGQTQRCRTRTLG
ncbi:hypothetical protein GGE68_001655 [Rhizobium leguminosarum]|nr:hypothetical protein [Rhizobium leguminosarum]